MGTNPQGWTEVGDGCFVRRYASFDLSVGVVAGEAGLLVVDTRASAAEGHELRADLRALGRGPVVAAVNTHEHVDHSYGNVAFRDLPVWAHESVVIDLVANEQAVHEAYRDHPAGAEIRDTTVCVPTDTFSSVASVDLGDRVVELVHPGRGHTAGDVVVNVADADVLYAGDLVESSGPPSIGDDAYPDEWPDTLEIVATMLTATTVVVPGHGHPVDKEFVLAQRLSLLPDA
jgi:glyoxylase-like metal-dependent hydrolase (beta-lactamase superfamily II)